MSILSVILLISIHLLLLLIIIILNYQLIFKLFTLIFPLLLSFSIILLLSLSGLSQHLSPCCTWLPFFETVDQMVLPAISCHCQATHNIPKTYVKIIITHTVKLSLSLCLSVAHIHTHTLFFHTQTHRHSLFFHTQTDKLTQKITLNDFFTSSISNSSQALSTQATSRR